MAQQRTDLEWMRVSRPHLAREERFSLNGTGLSDCQIMT